MKPITAAAVLAISCMVPITARSQQAQPRDEPQWSLGLGVISAPRPYVGADNQTFVVPLVGLEYKRLSVQGIRISYHLVRNDTFTLDARARYSFDGLDPDDSPFLEDMEARRGTVEAGLGLDWTFGPWALRGTAFTDILGRSDGQELGLDLSRTWTFAGYRWGLTPAVGAVWQSDDLIDYYYGVPPDEARPDRPAFAGEAALNLRTSLLVFYRISKNFNAVGLFQFQRFDNEISSSPIVDRKRNYFGLVGVNYVIGGQGYRGP